VFLSGEGLFRNPASPALTGILRLAALAGGERWRVGGISFGNTNDSANRAPPPTVARSVSGAVLSRMSLGW
jgi:hypothetical protein